MGDLTAPPWLGQDNALLWLLLIPAVILVVAIAIIVHFVEKKKNNVSEQKKEPLIFLDKINNNIIIIALNNYSEIEIQFTLYNSDKEIIKQYTIKEFNFTQDEQRVIANSKDFDAYKISYSIINYK